MRPLCQRPPAENSAQKQTASDPQRQSAGAVSNDDELTRAATPARGGRFSTVMKRTLTRKLARSDNAKPGIDNDLTDEHRESDSPGEDGKVSEVTNSLSENDTVGQLAQQMDRIDISDNEPPSAQADGITAAEFRTAQQNDLALRSMWVRAKTGNCEFCVINGLRYKRAPAHFVTTHEFLLVLPSSYIQEVIKLAHNLGGHFSVRKTYDRLNAFDYFPKIRDFVIRYIKCCKQCQMVAQKRLEERQPL